VGRLRMARQRIRVHGRHPTYPSLTTIDFQINPFVNTKTTFSRSMSS
jgi:hypothetical protein